VCPLMAMLRHRAAQQSAVPARLLYSARSLDGVIYRSELDTLAASDAGPQVALTLTRSQPPEWGGYRRRIDAAMLVEFGWPPDQQPLTYICGPTPLVESVAEALVGLGHSAARIKTERFGPTGG
jgi:ferredoxin-NADP reductase